MVSIIAKIPDFQANVDTRASGNYDIYHLSIGALRSWRLHYLTWTHGIRLTKSVLSAVVQSEGRMSSWNHSNGVPKITTGDRVTKRLAMRAIAATLKIDSKGSSSSSKLSKSLTRKATWCLIWRSLFNTTTVWSLCLLNTSPIIDPLRNCRFPPVSIYTSLVGL